MNENVDVIGQTQNQLTTLLELIAPPTNMIISGQ